MSAEQPRGETLPPPKGLLHYDRLQQRPRTGVMVHADSAGATDAVCGRESGSSGHLELTVCRAIARHRGPCRPLHCPHVDLLTRAGAGW